MTQRENEEGSSSSTVHDKAGASVLDSGTNLLHEARDAASSSYRSAREFAIEEAHVLAERARRAGSVSANYARRAGANTADFVSTNAIPLTLIGAGVGWLAWSLRKQSQRHIGGLYGDDFDASLEGEYPLRERAGDNASGIVERASERAHAIAEQTSELSHEARERLRLAGLRTRDFADENPLLVGAIAVAAGVGVGLLLPATQPENRLLGETRDRLLGEAKDLLGDARSSLAQVRDTALETAGQVGQRARQTAQELQRDLTDSRLSH